MNDLNFVVNKRKFEEQITKKYKKKQRRDSPNTGSLCVVNIKIHYVQI